MFKFIFLLPLLLVGCVTPAYQYEWFEYEPINYSIHRPIARSQLIYTSRYRPRPLYIYENIWYSEPHTIVIYEDNNGYRLRQKVPTSHLKGHLNKSRPYLKREKDVESIMKDIDKKRKETNLNLKKRKKTNLNLKKRKKTNLSVKKRKKNTKVYSPAVDTNNKSGNIRRTKQILKGRI